VEYPLGHRRRRSEALPLLKEKARTNMAACLPSARIEALIELCLDRSRLATLPVNDFMALLVV